MSKLQKKKEKAWKFHISAVYSGIWIIAFGYWNDQSSCVIEQQNESAFSKNIGFSIFAGKKDWKRGHVPGINSWFACHLWRHLWPCPCFEKGAVVKKVTRFLPTNHLRRLSLAAGESIATNKKSRQKLNLHCVKKPWTLCFHEFLLDWHLHKSQINGQNRVCKSGRKISWKYNFSLVSSVVSRCFFKIMYLGYITQSNFFQNCFIRIWPKDLV